MCKTISIDAATRLILEKQPVIFDMRDAVAYGDSRIPGAIHLTLSTVTSVLKHPRYNHPVLVYCYRGHSSRAFGKMLTDFGFSDVYCLEDGFEAWSSNGPSIERPLFGHAEVRSDPVMEWLLDQNGDPDDPNAVLSTGLPPLIKAAQRGLAEIVSGLIAAGADPSVTDAYGNDALWAACYSGNLATIAALLDAGIDIDRRNSSGTTALIYAASAGKTSVVAFLLEAGANPHLKTQDDFTAIELAANVEVLKLLKQFRKPNVAVS